MRRTIVVLFMFFCLALPLALMAQDSTASPTPSPTTPPTLTPLPGIETLEFLVTRAEKSASDAQGYLQVFQAISIALDLVVLFVGFIFAAAAYFGWGEFRDLRSQLNESRQQLINEQKNMAAMQSKWQDALLALSSLPLGDQQYKAGNLIGANDIYNRALSKYEQTAIINYYLGNVHTRLGNLDKAEEHLKIALDIDSEMLEAVAALGFVYRRQGENLSGDEKTKKFWEAEKNLRDALEASPNLVDSEGESWWGSLGGLYRRSNRLDEAIMAYEKADKVTPHSSYPTNNLALLYLSIGNFTTMLKKYHQSEYLAAREAAAGLTNYWGYADLLTARLAIGADESKIQDAFEWLLKIIPSGAISELDGLIDTLEKLADLFIKNDNNPDLLQVIPTDQLHIRIERIQQVITQIRSHIDHHKK